MLTKLTNLNESLEKIYSKAPAPTKLTEAYNPSFPDWLKDRLSAIRSYHGYPKNGMNDWRPPNSYTGSQVRKAYPDAFSMNPTYTIPKGANDTPRRRRKNSLFQSALDAGIDFNTTKVVEGPVPEKRTDERLKAPNIPIWGLNSKQVYIPGINDNEINQLDSLIGTTYEKYAFKFIPFKHLQANADHFAYIDGSTLDPDAYFDKKAVRAQNVQDVNQMAANNPSAGIYRNNPKSQWNDQFAPAGHSSFDASGYPIFPGRYTAELEKLKGQKAARILDQRYEDLIDAKEDIISAMSYYDPFDDTSEYSKLLSALQYLNNAVSVYNNQLSSLKGWQKAYQQGRMTEREYLEYASEVAKEVQNDNYWNALQDVGAYIFLAGADWLE